MIIFEVIRMALRGVRANLLRSMLTTLGIAVGVGCVVTLIAYSAGNTKQLLDQFSGFGTKSMTVSLDNFNGSTAMRLDLEDAAALRREIPVLEVAAAVMFFSNVDLDLNGAVKTGVTLTAVEPQYFKARTFELSSGHYFNQNDNLSLAPLAVIGANVKDELFMNLDPVGQQLLIQGKPFTVIGVMARRDEGRHGGSNDEVLIPPHTAIVEFPTMDPMVNIDIEVKDEKYLEFAKTRVTEVLEGRHPEIVLAKNERWSPLNVWMFNDWLKRRTAAANSMSRFLLVIGLLCLTIGAVGVMNIMLVAVEERTLEIGLRKALGATRAGIIGQFLSEALIVCLSGGAIGLGVAIVACAKMAAMPEDANVPDPLLTQNLMIGSILVSLVIALAAGTWPAVLASSTDPIESLSYE
ncbi:ABC transporter permease [bacterium]|nr:ABC transporter permease [bacterium]